MEKRPSPKYTKMMDVTTRSGKHGFINWNSQPSWSEEHKCWLYCFNYGLGASSEGRVRESDIIVNNGNIIKNIIRNIDPNEKHIVWDGKFLPKDE